ncbi:zinc ribbon domain-containing protein, partial [Candidatus Woesebacteria bacterium]|nr:zinc ribbon domain-containing protein [Candidatus Woesebacteria bacterium]
MADVETSAPPQANTPLSEVDQAFATSLEVYTAQVADITDKATRLSPTGILKAQKLYQAVQERDATAAHDERRRTLKGTEDMYHIVPVHSKPPDPRWGNVYNEAGTVDAAAIALHQEAFQAEVDAIIEKRTSILVAEPTPLDKLKIFAETDASTLQKQRAIIKAEIKGQPTAPEPSAIRGTQAPSTPASPSFQQIDQQGVEFGRGIGMRAGKGIAKGVTVLRQVTKHIDNFEVPEKTKTATVVEVSPNQSTVELHTNSKPHLPEYDSNGQVTRIPLTIEGAHETLRRFKKNIEGKSGIAMLHAADFTLSGLEKDVEEIRDSDIKNEFIRTRDEIENDLQALGWEAHGADFINAKPVTIRDCGFELVSLKRSQSIPENAIVEKVENVGLYAADPSQESIPAILVLRVPGKKELIYARLTPLKGQASPTPPDEPKVADDEPDDEEKDKPEKEPDTFGCPSCGDKIAIGTTFCPKCGFFLRGVSAPVASSEPSASPLQSPAINGEIMPPPLPWGFGEDEEIEQSVPNKSLMGKVKQAGGTIGKIVSGAFRKKKGESPPVSEKNFDSIQAFAAESAVMEKYVAAREKYLEWANEVTKGDSQSEILLLYKALERSRNTGRNWTEIFEAPYAATYVGQTEREKP